MRVRDRQRRGGAYVTLVMEPRPRDGPAGAEGPTDTHTIFRHTKFIIILTVNIALTFKGLVLCSTVFCKYHIKPRILLFLGFYEWLLHMGKPGYKARYALPQGNVLFLSYNYVGEHYQQVLYTMQVAQSQWRHQGGACGFICTQSIHQCTHPLHV